MVSCRDPGSRITFADQLTSAVKGFYFQWNNEQSNPAVKDWNITEMRVSLIANPRLLVGMVKADTWQIDRLKRHTDRQVVADFWRTLDGAKRR
jgi:parafibromin